MSTISPVIPRISQQIRLSLIFAKSSADSRVLIPLPSQPALMHNDSSSGLTTFEASTADRPFRQSRYGNADFHYLLRNQPRCNAQAGKRGLGVDRSPPSGLFFFLCFNEMR